MLRVEGQRLGIRWVGGERRYDVFGELLSRGEACLLAADQLGCGEGDLFGCRVRTSTAPARLALQTGRPLIVLTAFRRGTEIDIDLSEPLTERGSVAALHQAALSRIEEQLRHDPTQIVKTLLPFAEAADWIAERARLRVALATAREEVAALRKAMVDAPDDERPAARDRLREARKRLREVRAQSRALARPEPPPRSART